MKKTGLAFGGGAVLDASHIDVIKALEEMNTEVSFFIDNSTGQIKDLIEQGYKDEIAKKDFFIF